MYSYTIIVLIKVATVLRAKFLRKNARRCNRMGFVASASASASATCFHISLSLSSIMELRIVVLALYSFAPVFICHTTFEFILHI